MAGIVNPEGLESLTQTTGAGRVFAPFSVGNGLRAVPSSVGNGLRAVPSSVGNGLRAVPGSRVDDHDVPPGMTPERHGGRSLQGLQIRDQVGQFLGRQLAAF